MRRTNKKKIPGVIKTARIYNQFPRRYQYERQINSKSTIELMTDDLKRIASLGFNVVWVNPLQKPGGKKRQGNRLIQNSLYAMSDNHELNSEFFPKNSTQQQREKLLQKYTGTAKELGLIPIFDLVINHVANESNLLRNQNKIEGKKFIFKKKPYVYVGKFSEYIDWSEVDKNQNNMKPKWEDTLPLNYSNSNTINQIITKLWKPFIGKYLKPIEKGGYGFCGVRVDAVLNIKEEVQKKVIEIIQQYKPYIILAELMAKNPTKQKHIDLLKNVGYTHVLASGTFYWGTKRGRLENNHWLCKQVEELRTFKKYSSKNSISVVGISGNHDIGTLRTSTLLFSKNILFMKKNYPINRLTCLKVVTPEDNFKFFADDKDKEFECRKEMKARLFRIGLMCNGGYYMLAGDEFGVAHKPSVFNFYRESSPLSEKWGAGKNHDITMFVKCINYVLSKLPAHQGAEHIYMEEEQANCLGVKITSSGNKKIMVVCNLGEDTDYSQCLIEKHIKDCREIFLIHQNKYLSFVENDWSGKINASLLNKLQKPDFENQSNYNISLKKFKKLTIIQQQKTQSVKTFEKGMILIAKYDNNPSNNLLGFKKGNKLEVIDPKLVDEKYIKCKCGNEIGLVSIDYLENENPTQNNAVALPPHGM